MTLTQSETHLISLDAYVQLLGAAEIEDLRELIKTYPQHWLINGSGAHTESTSHSTTTNIDRSAPN